MKLYQGIHFWNIVIFFLFQSIFITCAQDNENFVKGNHYFTTAHYELAVDAYKKIEQKEFAVLYNLTLSYVHQGSRAQAILWGKRAEKKANFKELTQLYELFDFINQQNDSEDELSWKEQLANFFKKCILSISMLFLQILLLLAIIMLMIYCYQSYIFLSRKKLLSILFLYSALSYTWWYKNQFMHHKTGIVIKESIPVLTGPDKSFYQKEELHESDEVTIIKSQLEYYQINIEHKVGWVHSKDIELI